MLNLMMVDDERHVLDFMVSLVQAAGANVVAEFTRPKEALNWFREHSDEVDAVFLDISMPVIDGFAMADVIGNITPYKPVVFVTSYDQYAVKAFEMAALDYLLKPPSLERMEKTLQRISSPGHSDRGMQSEKNGGKYGMLSEFERLEVQEKKRLRSLLLQKMSGKHSEDVLLFREGNWEWVEKDRVSCFSKGKKDKFVQVLVEDKTYETVEKLNDFLLNFPQEYWINCFRAFYVNINHIERLEKTVRYDSALILKDSNIKIPVSRGCIDNVLLALHRSGQGNVEM